LGGTASRGNAVRPGQGKIPVSFIRRARREITGSREDDLAWPPLASVLNPPRDQVFVDAGRDEQPGSAVFEGRVDRALPAAYQQPCLLCQQVYAPRGEPAKLRYGSRVLLLGQVAPLRVMQGDAA
jgi:hypothetical protein